MGRCFYSGKASKGRALCNIPVNSHSWRAPSQANPGFLCGKIIDGFYEVHLGAKNGVKAQNYEFKVAKMDSTHGGSYSNWMRNICAKYDMKPVCDHPSYCKNDQNALYIGQSSHLAHGNIRDNTKYHASGWNVIKDKWAGLCSYTGTANHNKDRNLWNKALCNMPANSHSWQLPSQANPGFMCGRVMESASTLKTGSSLDKLLAKVRQCRSAGFTVNLGKVPSGGGVGGHRRLQDVYTGSSCSSKILPHRIQAFEAACCPNGNKDCPGGVPKKCTAECAVVYDPFYSACKKNFPRRSQKNMIKVLKECAAIPTAPVAKAIKASGCH